MHGSEVIDEETNRPVRTSSTSNSYMIKFDGISKRQYPRKKIETAFE